MILKTLANLVKEYVCLIKSIKDTEEIRKLKSDIKNSIKKVEHHTTNENLDAIIAGLDLKPDDSVLAVAGSGDQAFAILEYVRKVEAVDINPNQIDFIKLNVKALKLNKYDLFQRGPEFFHCVRDRQDYFLQQGRLNRIRSNLGNLNILEPSDIFSVRSKIKWSKIYLSNVLDHVDSDRILPGMLALLENLSLGGVIYAPGGFGSFNEKNVNCQLLGLKKEEELTEKAQRFQDIYYFESAVYRKVAEVQK